MRIGKISLHCILKDYTLIIQKNVFYLLKFKPFKVDGKCFLFHVT